MLFDRQKTNTQRPGSSSAGASLETQDMRQQVPQVNDILAEIDKALGMGQQKKRESDRCRC